VQSDAELVEAVLGGHRASFGILVQRYERAVLGVGLGILGDYHAAQDVTQEALVTAYAELKTLRRPDRFASWLVGIARRKAIDAWRRRSRQRSENGALEAVPNPGDPSLDDAAKEVLEAVERLPERLRQVVLNHYCDGLSVRQIAEATGSPVGTITKYLSRARVMLRKLLLEDSS
jgi:RNA polymerase sigma factor (sigma-70 family)